MEAPPSQVQRHPCRRRYRCTFVPLQSILLLLAFFLSFRVCYRCTQQTITSAAATTTTTVTIFFSPTQAEGRRQCRGEYREE